MIHPGLLLIWGLWLLLAAGSSNAAISFITEVNEDANDDRADLTVPNSVVDDDLLIVQVSIRNRSGSDGVTAPAGWTIIGSQQQDDDVLQSLYYRVASGDAGNNYEWDFDGNGNRRYVIGMSVFRGVDASNPIDDDSAGIGMSGNQVTAPAVVTSADEAMLVAFYSLEAGDQSFTPPAGMTEIYDEEEHNNGNGITAMAAYVEQALAGNSGNKVATASKSNDDAIGQLVALNAVVVAPSTPTLIAEYRFDELSWSGAAAEVEDATGNGFNGRALQSDAGVNTLEDGFICWAGTFPDTSDNTSYAVDSTLDIDGDIGSSGAISLWHRSNTSTSGGGSDKTLWDASSAGGDNKYFYLILLGNGRLRFGAEDSSDGDFRMETSSPLNIAAGQWMNIVVNWDVNGSEQAEFWVNGVKQTVTITNNTMNGSVLGNTYSLYIGDNRSTYFPSGSARAADGEIDEVLVFDGVLDSATINNIISLQSAGLNLDGSSRSCPSTPALEYRFEESSWNGSSAEVKDNSGNGVDGRGVNGANTASVTPAIVGDPGTCGYGEFDGANDYVELPASFGNKQQSFTITAWIRPSNLDNGSRILIDDQSNTGGYGFSVSDGNSGSGLLRFYSRSVSPVSVDTANGAVSNNVWSHVAAVHNSDDKSRQIYVNGVAQTITGGGTSNTYTGSWGVDNGPASIGGETDAGETANRFSGAIDEVRVYDAALTAAQVRAVFTQTHACPAAPAVDHFDIDHNSAAIYCAPTTITVSAEDAANNTVSDYIGTITLDTNSGLGDWSVSSGAGVFDNGADNDGVASYQYASSDNGVAVFLLDHSDTDTATPLSLNIAVDDGASTDDDLEGALLFSASGFTVTGQALVNNPPAPIDTNLPVPGQIAGTDFSVFIAAYGQTPEDASCGVIESYAGNKDLSFTVNYTDPATGTVSPTVNTDPIASPITINFSGGQAEATVKYKDVGRISLGVTEGGLAGSSNPFVVKPASFAIQLTGNPAASNASGGVFTSAGSDFPVTVLVLDAENDLTPNYANESSAESVALSHSKLLPVAGVDGSLNGALAKTAGATFAGNYNWDEVGIISLSAAVADGDYLGEGNVLSVLTPVGRFTPHHFALSLSSVTAANTVSTDFTYLGQPFFIDYTLQARSALMLPTQNYIDDAGENFAKLDLASVSNDLTDVGGTAEVAYGVVDTAATTSFNARLQATGQSPVWVAGVAEVIDLALTVDRAASVEAPFTVVEVGINVQDSDGIGFTALTLDTSLDTSTDTVSIGTLPGGLLYGRSYVAPVYGPETPAGSTTLMPFVVQYYDGNQFITHSNDSASGYGGGTTMNSVTVANHTANLSAAELTAADINFPLAGATVSAGEGGLITVNRPGAGNDGSVEVSFNVDSWLQFDWDSATAGDEAPTSVVTFGTYRGHDRIIYWRENHNP